MLCDLILFPRGNIWLIHAWIVHLRLSWWLIFFSLTHTTCLTLYRWHTISYGPSKVGVETGQRTSHVGSSQWAKRGCLTAEPQRLTLWHHLLAWRQRITTSNKHQVSAHNYAVESNYIGSVLAACTTDEVDHSIRAAAPLRFDYFSIVNYRCFASSQCHLATT